MQIDKLIWLQQDLQIKVTHTVKVDCIDISVELSLMRIGCKLNTIICNITRSTSCVCVCVQIRDTRQVA